MNNTTDPLVEAIESAIWDLYEGAQQSATGLVLANPRAVAAVAATKARAAVLPEPADRAVVLREAAQRLYTALFPAVYDDMGQKAAEGVNRAVSELRRMADEAQPTTKAVPDTLPEWLHWRFGPHGQPWSDVPDEDKALWEHQARAVRRAVARGGFKSRAAGARQDGPATDDGAGQ
ncbi:hypothetical protein [Streptomyces sp. Z423-1]|uniref:hypothetical protein n=1 Tax=unclassified Streptomyces TaxID=2593676 RepID=UPI0014896D89|nr:hypothetical protein [Streptomyces sp. Z423-1]